MASKIIPLACLLVWFLLAMNVADATIGMNWGRQNAQRLLPSNVVDLILQNGINEARVFTSEEDILRAFEGSGINLTVTISSSGIVNDDIKASNWVQMRQPYFNPSNIRQIYISDFAFSNGIVYSKAHINDAMHALECLQSALKDGGYGDQIKVTIPHNRGILKLNTTSFRPSEADFVDEIKPEMSAFLRNLLKNDAPFVFSINPISDVHELGLDLSFAIPDKKSTFVVRDVNGAVYNNVVELLHDSFIWALIKLNASNVKVIVGQVGWPTDGYIGANATMAEQFYKALLPLVKSNKGTPMRPKAPIDIYVQSLTDENTMPFYDGGSSFTRHWGIYRSNGKPKYRLDLSGQGRDVYPADAKGIMRMPERWCVFNGDWSNVEKVRRLFAEACARSDCTPLAQDGSCSHLDFVHNVSYAFNMYFQFQFQNETQCDFEGLGQVSTEDPSTPECVFPVEVVKSDERYAKFSAAGKRLHPIHSVIIMFMISILGTLFWN